MRRACTLSELAGGRPKELLDATAFFVIHPRLVC